MKVLVTGSTGYVGGRLVPALLAAGHEVRTTVTDPHRPARRWWRDRVETIPMDVTDRRQVRRAVAGVDAVYFLVHGMAGEDFMARDRRAAHLMAGAVASYGVGRVVYLSGLVPPGPGDQLSDHLASRLEVERILSDSPATVITLRAAIVVGSGSTSFEIVRQVSERLPAQPLPAWLRSRVQPIALVDVVAALVAALTTPGPSRPIDLGGPEAMPYAELLARYARVAGLTRPQLGVSIASTPLVGAAVERLTDVPGPVVRALVESLHHDMVAGDLAAMRELLPGGHRPVGFEEAVRRSLAAPGPDPATSDPMAAQPYDPAWAGGGRSRPLITAAADLAGETYGWARAARAARAIRRTGLRIVAPAAPPASPRIESEPR